MLKKAFKLGVSIFLIPILVITLQSCISTSESHNQDTCFDLSSLKAGTFSTLEGNDLDFMLYVPEDTSKELPLVVYLHGFSSKGDDLNLLTKTEDFPKYLADGFFEDVEAFVLIPQLSEEYHSWNEVNDELYQLIQTILKVYNIDKDNISLSGFSMGGTATWGFASIYPELFARIAPISGSAKSILENASELKNIAVWAFVGSADSVISPDSSIKMVELLNSYGGDASITEFEQAEHEEVPPLAWSYDDKNLFAWLINNEE